MKNGVAEGVTSDPHDATKYVCNQEFEVLNYFSTWSNYTLHIMNYFIMEYFVFVLLKVWSQRLLFNLVQSSNNGILLPKLFWPTERKNCFSDREKLLKFEIEGQEFAKFLQSLEQYIQTVKGQNNFR